MTAESPPPPGRPALPLGQKPYSCQLCGRRLHPGQIHYARLQGEGDFRPLCPPCYQEKTGAGE